MPARRLTKDERLNRAHWDDDADAYRRRHGRALAGDVRWGPGAPPERELRILGDVTGRDVLEVGCGQGQAVLHVRALGARRCAGVDLSPAMLAHARRAAQEAKLDVAFVETPADDLSAFADASFDVVFSAQAMGFFPDLGAVLAECARVLRPGGRLAFSWSSPLWQIVAWDDGPVVVETSYFAREVHRDPGGAWRPWTEFRRTYGDYVRALRAAGFEVVDVVEPEPTKRDPSWSDAYPMRVMRKVPATTIWVAEKR